MRRYSGVYREEWGEPYYTFGYRNAGFIVLNTDAPGNENRLGPQQFRWLERTLEASRAEHLFVFLHRPPGLMKNAARLHALLRQHPVRYVFYGHHHHYHHEQRDGIRYVMTNAAANMAHEEPRVGGFQQLLLVAVRDDDVSLAVVKADGLVPPESVRATDNYDLFALGRHLLPAAMTVDSLGPQRFRLTLPFDNRTQRELHAYVSCRSDDARWAFEPLQLAPITLAAGSKASLTVVAAFDPTRVPESVPVCDVRVPYQTHLGAWLDFEGTVEAPVPNGASGD